MFSQPIQKLVDQFRKFPGVGPRQAARFVFYLLREDPSLARELADSVSSLHNEVKLCELCYKAFDTNGSMNFPRPELGTKAPQAGSANSPQTSNGTGARCEICRNTRRDPRKVLVVEKETDLANIEDTGSYNGLYHVLGGTVDPLDSTVPARLHLRELHGRVVALAGSGAPIEVIVGTNPTTEGEATAQYIERILAPLSSERSNLKVSRLGRGISTGSDLEYADATTIENAIKNRK